MSRSENTPLSPISRCVLKLAGIAAVFVLLLGCSGMRQPMTPSSGHASQQAVQDTQLDQNMGEYIRNLEPHIEHYRIGRYFQQQREYEVAIEKYKEALQKNSEHIEAWNALGVAWDKLGKYRKAEKAYKKALQIDPEQPHVLNNLGYCYLLQDEPNAAVTILQKATSLKKGNAFYINNLSVAYVRKGEYYSALRELNRIHGREKALKELTRIITREKLTQKLADSRENLGRRNALQKLRQSILREVPNEEEKNKWLQVLATRNSEKAKQTRETVVRSHMEQKLKRHVLTLATAKIEVSNGNGRKGMARHVANSLEEKGFSVTRISNARYFCLNKSTIFHLDGYLQQARLLSESIPGEQDFIQVDALMSSNIQIKLILGHDLIAQFEASRFM